MKASKIGLGQALDRPDAALRFYLFHGPDEAGSRALATRLLKGLGNAERFVLIAASVKNDPASLADEAGAMALFGGARALWIEPAGDEIVEGVEAVLGSSGSESAVIAIAGALRRTSSLLKLAEAHPAALAHCSYIPEGREMERVIAELARGVGLRLAPDVSRRLAAAANNNQAIAESELEKFSLYLDADPAHPRDLEHETLDLLSANASEGDLLRIGDLALAGKMDALLSELERLPSGGNEVLPIIRALQRRLLMLAPLRLRMERGESVDAVLTSMGKALFWKDKELVRRLLTLWSTDRIGEAAGRLSKVERQALLGKAPVDANLGEVLVTLSRVGQRR